MVFIAMNYAEKIQRGLRHCWRFEIFLFQVCILFFNPSSKSCFSFQVKWFKNNELLENNLVYKITSKRLILDDIKIEHEGVYRCTATNFLKTVQAESKVFIGGYLNIFFVLKPSRKCCLEGPFPIWFSRKPDEKYWVKRLIFKTNDSITVTAYRISLLYMKVLSQNSFGFVILWESLNMKV